MDKGMCMLESPRSTPYLRSRRRRTTSFQFFAGDYVVVVDRVQLEEKRRDPRMRRRLRRF